MGRQFSARTLKLAYELASKKLKMSVIELNIKVIRKPKSGIFGFFQQDAIIEVLNENIQTKDDTNILNKTNNINTLNHTEKNNKIIEEINSKVNLLFSNICFHIEKIEVSMYSKDTVLIKFSGENHSSLIGKQGYKYKALSYMLFNWINHKYSLMLRLEVGQHLQLQEDSIALYLEPIITNIEKGNIVKTKPLNGVALYTALTILRKKFPKKYIAVKINIKGDKYILINEYKNNVK
jgi:spoIIIJ-associated protein